MEPITIGTIIDFVSKSFASYTFPKVLDAVFKSRKDFYSELAQVVNDTIMEYDKKYPLNDIDGKYSFHKSQKIIDELLKYRIMRKEGYDTNKIKVVLEGDNRIIPPSIDDLRKFYEIFDAKIKANVNLRELEISSTYQEEIFLISQRIDEYQQSVTSLVFTYNGDLQAQWRDRLNAYVDTLKQFKPRTAFELLVKFQESFSSSKNKPDNELLAIIEFQKGVCQSLLGDKVESCKAFIAAHNKDKGNIRYKEKAALSYVDIMDYPKAIELKDELISIDEYNLVGWALYLILEGVDSVATNIKVVPDFVKRNRRFQSILYNHYVQMNRFDIVELLEQNNIIVGHDALSPVEVSIDNYNEAVFITNIISSHFLRSYNYVNFTKIEIGDIDILKKLAEQLKSLAASVNCSEVLLGKNQILALNSFTQYLLTLDKKHVLEMHNIIKNESNLDELLQFLCSNILQIEGYDDLALSVIDKMQVNRFDALSLRAFIYLKNQDITNYVNATKEFFQSISEINIRELDPYINSMLMLKWVDVYNQFEPEEFYVDKVFNDKNVEDLVIVIAETLKTNDISLYVERYSNLIEYFKTNTQISLYIADVHYYAKEYATAVELYRPKLNCDYESRSLYYYIISLDKLNTESELLLDLLKKWRLNYSFNPDLLRREFNLCVLAFDWQRALDIVEYGLSQDNTMIGFAECRLLVLDKLEKGEQFDVALVDYLAIVEKDENYLNMVSTLLLKREKYEDALDLIYNHCSDDNILMQQMYLQATLVYSNKRTQQTIMLEFDEVEIGHFVKYSINGEEMYIEIKSDCDNPIIQNLVGKKKNETFEMLRKISRQKDSISILRIMDKYLCLHDKICHKAHNPYSGLKMEFFSFENSSPESLLAQFIKLFGEEGDDREKYTNEQLEKYYCGQISYSEVIMNVYGGDYLGGYYHLSSKQRGILVIPLPFYMKFVRPDNSNYIIDLSTLPILFQISEKYKIDYPNKFYLSKHIIEKLKAELIKLKTGPLSELSIVTTSKGVTRYIHTQEDHDKSVKYLEGMLAWIDIHCIAEVSPRTIDFMRELQTRDDYKSQSDFIDYTLNTILLREDKNAFLISDDTLYLNHLNVPFQHTISSEFFLKSALGDDQICLNEFLYNRYIGYTYSSSQLINEFEKSFKGEYNLYDFCISNYIPVLLKEYTELMLYIASHKELSQKLKMEYITPIASKIIKNNISPNIISMIKTYIEMQWYRYPQEAIKQILDCFEDLEYKK